MTPPPHAGSSASTMQQLLQPPTGTEGGAAPSEAEPDANIPRCHTMPVKQLAAMAKKLREQQGLEAAGRSSGGASGTRGSSGSLLMHLRGSGSGEPGSERQSRASKLSITSHRKGERLRGRCLPRSRAAAAGACLPACAHRDSAACWVGAGRCLRPQLQARARALARRTCRSSS